MGLVRRPNFFLVGAMKAGTTSMHRYLAQHPDIFMSDRKEPRYSGFVPDLDAGSAADGRWFTRSLDEYLANFAAADDEQIVGESSHVYLHSQRAARLIREFAPEARILILLRDPVEMVRSRHQQSVWMTREDITDLAEALAAEADRREGRRLPADAPYHAGLQYRQACTMAPQVRRYLETFDRSRVHVVLLEDISAGPLDAYRGVLEFLGVDPEFVPARMDVANPAKTWRRAGVQRLRLRLRHASRPLRSRLGGRFVGLSAPYRRTLRANRRRLPRERLPADLGAELTDYFAADVAELSELLGRDLTTAWPRFRPGSEAQLAWTSRKQSEQ
jgi:hypothetical protein